MFYFNSYLIIFIIALYVCYIVCNSMSLYECVQICYYYTVNIVIINNFQAVVSYIKSVFLCRNKSIFDVSKLNIDKYAMLVISIICKLSIIYI